MNIFDIPIITYHKISSKKEFGLTTVSPSIFKQQMQTLSDNKFQAITFKQYKEKHELPQNPVIISFDDSYKSVYENAFPIMKEFNFKGVLFVVSDYLGKKNDWEAYPIQRKHYHANKDEIGEMQKFGFEIGSHCRTHRYLPQLSRAEIEKELQGSKQDLEDTFKTEIITCCYPYGGYNKQVADIAKDLDYKFGTGNIKYFSYNKNFF